MTHYEVLWINKNKYVFRLDYVTHIPEATDIDITLRHDRKCASLFFLGQSRGVFLLLLSDFPQIAVYQVLRRMLCAPIKIPHLKKIVI